MCILNNQFFPITNTSLEEGNTCTGVTETSSVSNDFDGTCTHFVYQFCVTDIFLLVDFFMKTFSLQEQLEKGQAVCFF